MKWETSLTLGWMEQRVRDLVLVPPNQKIGYLEWKLESGQLAIYQYSKGRYSFGWLSRRVTMEDNPTSRFSIVDVSPTHFKLRTDDGKEFTLTATEDKDLECAK